MACEGIVFSVLLWKEGIVSVCFFGAVHVLLLEHGMGNEGGKEGRAEREITYEAFSRVSRSAVFFSSPWIFFSKDSFLPACSLFLVMRRETFCSRARTASSALWASM